MPFSLLQSVKQILMRPAALTACDCFRFNVANLIAIGVCDF